MEWIVILILILLILILYRFNVIVPESKGLPVLLYHKISQSENNELTVTNSEFENQIKYLKENSYNPITLTELIDNIYSDIPLPENPVLITFDDGYKNNIEFALPVLKKYNFKASIFLPVSFIGKTNLWDDGNEKLLNIEEIKNLHNDTFEFGLHSFSHKNFKNIPADEIKQDISECVSTLKNSGIKFTPAFAYPYGGRPKNKLTYNEMLNAFQDNEIKISFRIGNRVNKLPISNKFEIKRISISGYDNLVNFKTKLRKGRLKQF
ncbi:MAG: polysaccharide deacetylase family protein [Ignavibacteria bacterium]|nr:polysaccharide deacetylase family protein [Ignavibacteria bacterium]